MNYIKPNTFNQQDIEFMEACEQEQMEAEQAERQIVLYGDILIPYMRQA